MFILLLIFLHIFPRSSNAALSEYSCDEEHNKILKRTQIMFQQSEESFPLKEGPYTVADLICADSYFRAIYNRGIPSDRLLLSQEDLCANDKIYDSLQDVCLVHQCPPMENIPDDPEDPEFHLDIPTLAKVLEEASHQIGCINPYPADENLLRSIEDLSIHQDLLLACKALYEGNWDLACKKYCYWYSCVHLNRFFYLPPKRFKRLRAVYAK
ncbi:MAG: hypothetical protein OXC30_00325 [Alphaproteobacteria bacterium]|nr:hypothetical protein [Alphaproteobacteria bacterium]